MRNCIHFLAFRNMVVILNKHLARIVVGTTLLHYKLIHKTYQPGFWVCIPESFLQMLLFSIHILESFVLAK